MFRVTFELEGKLYRILAKEIDMLAHPYFIIISGLEFCRTSLIINPDNEDAQKRFKDVDRIHIPAQSMKLIEEISEEEARISTLKAVK